MPKEKSVASVKAELQSVLGSELAARKFSYPRSDGSSWTLALRDVRSEEHTSELQSQFHLVCRLLLEKKNDSGRHGCPHETLVQHLSSQGGMKDRLKLMAVSRVIR